MSRALLPHQTTASGNNQPCPGMVTIDAIDMRFEDYPEGKRFLPDAPFWAVIPGSNAYLVYHGNTAPFGSPQTFLMSAKTAAPYIEKYEAAPQDWWKYAEALNGNDRVKLAYKLRDGETPSKNACGDQPAGVLAKYAH